MSFDYFALHDEIDLVRKRNLNSLVIQRDRLFGDEVEPGVLQFVREARPVSPLEQTRTRFVVNLHRAADDRSSQLIARQVYQHASWFCTSRAERVYAEWREDPFPIIQFSHQARGLIVANFDLGAAKGSVPTMGADAANHDRKAGPNMVASTQPAACPRKP